MLIKNRDNARWSSGPSTGYRSLLQFFLSSPATASWVPGRTRSPPGRTQTRQATLFRVLFEFSYIRIREEKRIMFRKQHAPAAGSARAWKWIVFALALAVVGGAMVALQGAASAA